MQFVLDTTGQAPDLAAIEAVVRALDPAALVDLDGNTHSVRIATTLTGGELRTQLRSAGVPAEGAQLVQLPSDCCGGCGG
jgi:hypothetical protein